MTDIVKAAREAMDDDLVKRLRKGDVMDGRTVNCRRDQCNCCTMDEAADRIEADAVTIADLREKLEAAKRERVALIETRDMMGRLWEREKASAAAASAALKEAVATINCLRELNMTAEDANGHRWANSDLAEQEIVAFLAKHGSKT